ncbi:MAG: flagellar biosynthesis anti-sigma factor FlgM [Acidobacteriia bacterium]|nr:flagellar biosynthesis anti-sigma factor FlgM [Terriglobia bacterium]
MRVDLLAHGPEPPDNNKTSRAGQGPPTPAETSETAGMDEARFSFGQARTQSLAAEVMAQPEIREQKVGALQKLLVTGRYTVSDAQIAQSMVSEAVGGNSGM